MITSILGSWPGVFGVWLFCGAWLAAGFSQNTLTLALSIIALTFTQLVLREQAEDNRREHAKLDALVHGVPDVDDSVADA